MSNITNLITHIFNEEYLLPFWLNHHKDIFDQIIIIDYNSTDKSIKICKSICPECKIIKTKNKYFDAHQVDKEVMDIENTIDGIKIVLNTTEFLFCEKSIKEIFFDIKKSSFYINCITPYSINNYDLNNEIFGNLLNSDIVYHNDRGLRTIHNYSNGNYTLGRHYNKHDNNIIINDLHIIWFGFYPMNENLLNRKLQIKKNMTKEDIIKGFGFQHLYSKEKILSINNEKVNAGYELKYINLSLYNLLNSKYKKI